MHLDLNTVAITVMLFEVAAGMLAVLANRSYPEKRSGLKAWGYLTIWQGFSWPFFNFGTYLPVELHKSLVPFLLVTTLWGYSIVLRKFFRRRPYHHIFMSLLVFVLSTLIIFTHIIPSELYRGICIAVVVSILSGQLVGILAYRNPESGFVSHKLLAGIYLFLGSSAASYATYFTLQDLRIAAFSMTIEQVCPMAMLCIGTCCTVSTYAYMLMCNDRYSGDTENGRCESEFQMVRDGIPVMIWKLDAHGDISWFNKAWGDFTGQKLDNARQADWFEFVHADDKNRVLAVIENAQKTLNPYHVEFRLRRKDGVFRWVLETGFPMHDDDGIISGFAGSTIDITETKDMETALAQKKAKLNAIFELLPIGLSILDPDKGNVENNAALLNFFEMAAHEIQHMGSPAKRNTILDASGVPLREEDFPSSVTIRTGQPVRNQEVCVITQSGKEKWALVSSEALPSPQSGIVVMTFDITERKRQQQQIEALSAEIFRTSEAERSQIAGELHDSLGQHLVLASMRISSSIAELPGITEEAKKVILEPIAAALRIAREISHRLVPAHLESIGLKLAVDDLVASITQDGKFIVHAETEALQSIFPGGWNIDLYRIIQEALTNILKHAGADEIRLVTEVTHYGMSVTIKDNGTKDPVERKTEQGIGLLLMQQRAKSFGGKINFVHADSGFAVCIEIPGQFDTPVA